MTILILQNSASFLVRKGYIISDFAHFIHTADKKCLRTILDRLSSGDVDPGAQVLPILESKLKQRVARDTSREAGADDAKSSTLAPSMDIKKRDEAFLSELDRGAGGAGGYVSSQRRAENKAETTTESR